MNLGRTPLPFSRFLIAAAFGAAVAMPLAARADRPQPVSESKTLHEWAALSGTGPVLDPPGPINFDGGVHPAAIPVFFPFDGGTVDLTALLRSGTVSGSIDVAVHGYTPGDYTVSAVTESSSSTVVLGTLRVAKRTFPIFSGSGVIALTDGAKTNFLPVWGFDAGSAKFGTKKKPFPEGFSPFDVATVSVTDSTGNVISTATLTPVHSGYLTALSPMVSGTIAPGATGYALVHADTPPVFYPLAPIETPVMTLSGGVGIVISPQDNGGIAANVGSGSITFPIAAGTVASPQDDSGATLTINSGSTTLSGSLSYTGGMVIDGGALTVGTGSGPYTGTLTISNTSPASPIVGTESLTLSGIGSAGGLTINGGTLNLGQPGGTLSLPFQNGRIVLKAQGLPASTALTYAADGTDLGTTTTDSDGNLTVYVTEGWNGKLPPSLDLFSVTSVTVHDGAGNVYLSAGF